MDYVKRLSRLDDHIKDNPKDYQAVIARLKLRSAAYEYARKKRMDEKLAKVAYYRRLLDEEQNE